MTDHTILELTRNVIGRRIPEELPLLDDPKFPDLNVGNAGTGPMGLGLDVALLFVAPFVYAFFEALIKEAGKSVTSEVITYLKGRNSDEGLEEKIANFMIEIGVSSELAKKVAHDIKENAAAE